MNAALFVLLLSVAGMKNAFAQLQVATLQHNNDVTAYYGSGALAEAHDAAESGDIITLSSGSFTAVNITKAITLRGAGCVADTVAGTVATIIVNECTLSESDTLGNHLNIEGIYFPNKVTYNDLTSPTFTRCNFNQLSDGWNPVMQDAQFVNCVFKDCSFDNAYNAVMVNCVAWHPTYVRSDRRLTIYNTIFGRMTVYATGLTAYNSIIIRDGGNAPSEGCIFSNCIGIGLEGFEPFGSAFTQDCISDTTYAAVFATYDGTFDFREAYELTDDAKAFETTDGTEVGIHGGAMPYNARPTYQVLKTINVANRSNAEGKLNVEIEVLEEE